MRCLFALAGLLLSISPLRAQGAVVEELSAFAGIARPEGHRGRMPARVDLTTKTPPVRWQFSTSTCVSWAATYVAASYALRRRGLSPDITLSPAFTYNQVAADPLCLSPTKISKTLDLLRDVGALPLNEFAFDGGWCGRQPTPNELERAKQFRISGWKVFDASDVEKTKEQLAREIPVIFNMKYTARMAGLRGETVLEDDDAPVSEHTMVVVGYDDDKKAFLIQNSSGRAWGKNGYGWFGYAFWKRNAKAGFVID